MASMIPATRLASVCRAAKPMIAAASAPEARRLAATRWMPVNWVSASRSPMARIPSHTSRRMKRRRVSACWEMPPLRMRSARSRCPRDANQRSTSTAMTTQNRNVPSALRTSPLSEAQLPMARSARMAAQPRARAVLLDAMGTLLTFEPPAPRLRAALLQRCGVDVGETAAGRGIRDEISYYRAHLHEGADAAGLAALRLASAEAMRPALGLDVPGRVLTELLLTALRFHALPRVPDAL